MGHSCKLKDSYEQSTILMEFGRRNGEVSMAMLVYQRVYMLYIQGGCPPFAPSQDAREHQDDDITGLGSVMPNLSFICHGYWEGEQPCLFI